MKKIESLKKMSKTKKLLLLSFVSLLLLSCAKDIYVDPPNSVRGYYYGTYEIISNFSNSAEQDTRLQYVYWEFTDQRFDCEADTTRVGRQPFTCDFYGAYEVEAAIEFTQVYSKLNMVCDNDDFPFGVFNLTWGSSGSDDTPDTLKIEHADYSPSVDEKRIIKLVEFVPETE
ncbi:MAG: hypothetical protein GY865_14215 [candidate division Zixibacteria bacterium]|nr:hypothetical protein [candidate division Zixibacteria bacterium]